MTPTPLRRGRLTATALALLTAALVPGLAQLPALFVGDWALTQLWLFIVAPLIGAALASAVHTVLYTGAAPVEAEQSAVAAETEGDAASRAAARRSRRRT